MSRSIRYLILILWSYFWPRTWSKVFENVLYVLGKDAYSAVVGGMLSFAHKVELNIATFSRLFFEGIKEDNGTGS